jgi:uncharacterized membrane protein
LYFFALLIVRTFLAVKNKFVDKIKIIFVILAIVGCYFVYETGEHGGKLVYKYGIGTDIIKSKGNK